MSEETINEKLDKVTRMLEEGKVKPYKSRKLKLSKSKVKKGYAIVCKLEDNGNADFEKVPIIDSTIKLLDTNHAIKDVSVFYHKGKPFIIQAKRKLNPFDLSGKNETYGQRYIMARMLNDAMQLNKPKAKGLILIGIIVLVVAGYYFYGGA